MVACSALRRAYRDILIGDRPDTVLVYLQGSQDLIASAHAERDMAISCRRRCWTASSRRWKNPARTNIPIIVDIGGPPDAVSQDVIRRLKEHLP